MIRKIFIILILSVSMGFAETAGEYYELGNKAEKENRIEDAIRYWEQAGEKWKAEGKKEYYGTMMSNIGYVYKERGQHRKALKYYKKALTVDEELGKKEESAVRMNYIGLMYNYLGQYDKAIEHFKKALAVNTDLGKKVKIATNLNNIGMAFDSRGEYNKAVEYYKKALDINTSLGEKRKMAVNLNNLGYVYDSRGEYGKALEYYRKALVITKEAGNKKLTVSILNNIGVIYKSWGQYDKALEYYNKALVINTDLGRKDQIAINLNNIGMVYKSRGKYDEALRHFEKALAIDKELGRKANIAVRLSNIGSAYEGLRRYNKALEYHKKALAIDEEIGKKGDVAADLNNIGLVYVYKDQYKKAVEFYKKALAINEELGQKDQVAANLNNIGAAYHDTKKFSKAVEYFNKSLAIKEQLRLTAQGAVRMDYLASQLFTYQFLTAAYIRQGKPGMAFNTVELSSAKYLAERMRGGVSVSDIDVSDYQKHLEDESIIINYANTEFGKNIAQITADRRDVNAIEVNKEQTVKNINKKYKPAITSSLKGLRGFKITKKEVKKNKKERKTSDEFSDIINYYRLLLSAGKPNARQKEAMKYIGRELYTLLISHLEKYISGKKELIIMPDGILAFLPFETLIMPDGRYLIEKYNIRYVQSLSVSNIINKRRYSKRRKPLLAFGGAVYNRLSYKADMISSEQQLKELQKETFLAMNRGASVRKAYGSLGLVEWSNLPGTLTEVNAIKKIITDADVETKTNVDESRIKTLSKKGKLKKYKVIHFATHGLVVPEMPELSAIVLSIFKNEKNGEDGYLCMKEIAKLDLNADFVCLSACETGLGKIYGGEGVVGLTQSFLIAGANALSVSLWQVADRSTMEFMVGVYKLVREKGISYDKAITGMKREFIAGKKYASPFYWAPFVYYGE